MHSSCPWTRAIPPIFICLIFVSVLVRDGPLENLSGGGGVGGRRTMKIFAQGKINKRNSCMPINPKKFSCTVVKKIITPPPPTPFPMNFLMAVLWLI